MLQPATHDPATSHAEYGTTAAGARTEHDGGAHAMPENSPHALRKLTHWLASQLEERRPCGTIAALDGVRAIACLSVLGYHISLITRDTHLWSIAWNPLLSSLMLAGGAGVTLFFVLSGLLLFLPYAQALLYERSWPSARRFYLRRALRIMPGYYASLVLIVLLARPEYLEPRHWRDLLLFAVFLMDSTPTTFQQINGPYWTLAIEWQFYLLLPLIALGIGWAAHPVRPARRPSVVVGCLLALIGWGLATRGLGDYVMAHPAATLVVPRRVLDIALFFVYGYRGKFLEDFAVGMLVGLAYTALRDPRSRVRRVGRVRRAWRLSPWLWGAGLVLLLYMAMSHYSQGYGYVWPVLPGLFRLPGWSSELGFALGFGCCILAILSGASALGRCFTWTPLRWIGLISYSLYIWHLPLMLAFMDHVGPSLRGLPGAAAYSLYWIWAALVVVPFACAGYLLIERPGMRLGDRLRRRMAPPRGQNALDTALPPCDSAGGPGAAGHVVTV